MIFNLCFSATWSVTGSSSLFLPEPVCLWATKKNRLKTLQRNLQQNPFYATVQLPIETRSLKCREIASNFASKVPVDGIGKQIRKLCKLLRGNTLVPTIKCNSYLKFFFSFAASNFIGKAIPKQGGNMREAALANRSCVLHLVTKLNV